MCVLPEESKVFKWLFAKWIGKAKNIIKDSEMLSEHYKKRLGRCAWLGSQENLESK